MAKKPTHPILSVFLRGLALVLPLALTAFLLIWVWNVLADSVVYRLDAGVKSLVELAVETVSDPGLTAEEISQKADEVLPPGLRMAVSIVGTLALILFLGWWLSGFIGRRIYAGFERLISKVPLIGAVYPYAKQITDFFFGSRKKVEFERVIAFPYPRLNVYSLAFLTGSSLEALNKATGEELISVFVPSSPMPATGYTLFVAAREIVQMNLTVEEALRIIISGGVLVPDKASGAPRAPGGAPPPPLPPAAEPARGAGGMSFAARLFEAAGRKGTPAVVGLDPRAGHLPAPFAARAAAGPEQCAAAFAEFHRALLDVVAPRVPAVKPNAAFFECLGAAGWRALADLVEAGRERGLLVIMDAKRGDIGSTAEAYARAFFGGQGFPPCDALTIHPFLGPDSCEPFLDAAREHDAGIFVLVKTSNPGAGFCQDHGEPPLADKLAAAVSAWGAERVDDSGWSSVGAVVGATRPGELAHFRELMPRAPFLLPGFGFQGGGAAGLEAAFDGRGRGAIVNASRSILWAHEREDLAHLPGWEARTEAALDEMIHALEPLAADRS